MRRLALSAALLLALPLLDASRTALAQPGVTYPRVYGPTGTLYGPTQANYQYLRQSGRAWVSPSGQVTPPAQAVQSANGIPAAYPSYNRVNQLGPYSSGYYGVPSYGSYYGTPYGSYYENGVHIRAPFVSVDVGRYTTGYGYGYVDPGYGYGGGYPATYGHGFESFAPIVRQAHPLWVGPDPFDNEVLARARLEEQLRWQAPLGTTLAVEPVTQRPKLAVAASSPEMIRRSLEHRLHGDSWFRKQRYSTAYGRYKSALTAASDIADNHLRLGFSLVAMNRPEQAAEYFRDALALDPLLPQTGVPLRELFGPENDLSRTSVILRTSDWVREDIRDPERLFVLGVVLHFDGQEDKAAQFFETAYRLAGRGDHLRAFLELPQGNAVEAAEAPAAGQPPIQPQVIDVPPAANADLAPPAADPNRPGIEPPRPNFGPELPLPE
jgi:tetratricopeptide (TPR) repeat protein